MNWDVEGAASITLSGGDKGLPASGSLTLDLVNSQALTLMATNACGPQSESIQIAVGQPMLVAAGRGSSVGPSSLSPGQLLAAKFDNLADPSRVDFLVLTAADGEKRAVQVYNSNSDGTIYALAPYWLDVDLDSGYRTGTFQLSALLTDGTSTGSVPLTITPLQYSGDAVAEFRRSLDSLSATVQESYAALRANGQGGFVDSITTFMSAQEALLRKAANDVAAGGTGTLYWGADTADNSGSTSVTVTRQDFVELAALQFNAAQSLLQLGTTPGVVKVNSLTRGADSERDAGTCIRLTRPLVPLCKTVSIKKKTEAAATEMLSDFLTSKGAPEGTDAQIQAWVKKQLAKKALGAALKKIQSWLNVLEATCLVAPIRLDRFDASPKLIPHARTESEATKVAIKAMMSQETSADAVADYLEKQEAKSLANQFKIKGVPTATAQKYIQAFLKLENHDMDVQIAKAAEAAGNFQPFDSVQVGQCDLQLVFPKLNGPGTASNPNSGVVPGRSRLQFATSQPFGQDDYYLMGIKPGPETLCIAPYVLNFVFHEDAEMAKGSLLKSSCPFRAGINIPRGAEEPTTGPVYSDDLSVDVGTKTADVFIGNAIVEPFATHSNQGMTPMARVGAPYVRSATDGLASASIDFHKSGPGTWDGTITASMVSIPNPGGGQSPHQASAQLTVFFENPENRRGTQRIRINVQNSGDTHCFFPTGLYAGTQRAGANGYGSSSYSVDAPRATTGNFTITADAMYRNPGESATCTATVKVELLDQ
ncbi:hypothetical protein [uncultured Paludibaculum sp.]|uniref:hypothetical protein n=1 Tax=uncultured Paludibaculum sp. TaxID=1765020 RepID=UPI002AABE6B9|nr:hypothetical protein [uncultured Paludibaculum sp.]